MQRGLQRRDERGEGRTLELRKADGRWQRRAECSFPRCHLESTTAWVGLNGC